MTPEQFVKKAIEGGWRRMEKHVTVGVSQFDMHDDYHAILNDPLAWQAVVKVEGWKPAGEHGMIHDIVGFYMHNMIDVLIEGESLEQFLETL